MCLRVCVSGYGVLGEWSCALRVLERMRDKGVRPTIVTYGTLMKVPHTHTRKGRDSRERSTIPMDHVCGRAEDQLVD
jgi:pentatricopeptide repeat protein